MRAFLAGLLVLAVGVAQAQPVAPQPYEGQPGKDILWDPTPESAVRRMLRMGGVGPADYVIDLGAGDGRIVITAAREFGARGLGVEYDAGLVARARANARAAGVESRVRFEQGDLFESDFSAATVLTLYLEEDLNLRLRERVLALRPGTRVVSRAFGMGDWKADVYTNENDIEMFFWVVPARVEGAWEFTLLRKEGVDTRPFRLAQRYQDISGDIEGHLRGGEISFRRVETDHRVLRCTGRVDGDRMAGTCRQAGAVAFAWSASRTAGAKAAD